MSDEQLIRKNQSGLSKRSESLISRGLVSLDRVIWTSKKVFGFSDGEFEDEDGNWQVSLTISPDGLFCRWTLPDEWSVANMEIVEFNSGRSRLIHSPIAGEKIIERWQSDREYWSEVLDVSRTYLPNYSVWSPCGNYVATTSDGVHDPWGGSIFRVVYDLTENTDGECIDDDIPIPSGWSDSNYTLGPRKFFKWDWDYSHPTPKLVRSSELLELPRYSVTELLDVNDSRQLNEEDAKIVELVQKNRRLYEDFSQRITENETALQEKSVQFKGIRDEAYMQATEQLRRDRVALITDRMRIERIVSCWRESAISSPDGKLVCSSWQFRFGRNSQKDELKQHFLTIEEIPSLTKIFSSKLEASALVWSHSSKRVYFSSKGCLGTLSIHREREPEIELTDIEAERILSNPAFDIAALFVLPAGDLPGRVDIVDCGDLSVIESHDLSGPVGNHSLRWSNDGSRLWILTDDGTATQAEIPSRLLQRFA